MKKLIFSGNGFPIHVQTYQYLQETTLNGIKALANMHENYTVLWGIEPNSNNTQVSEGAFVYNGEIIPFLASVPGDNITVTEVIENFDFNTDPDNITSLEMLPAYSYKSAKIGTGGTVVTFPFSQLKRLLKTKIFQLTNFEFNSSGGFVRDITSEVDINIVKRAVDWDFCFIETNGGDKSVRSLKQHDGSLLIGAGFVNDAKLIYTATNVRIQLNVSNGDWMAPKLIIHYL